MKFIDTTLSMEPNNSQAKELKQLIKQKQDRGLGFHQRNIDM